MASMTRRPSRVGHSRSLIWGVRRGRKCWSRAKPFQIAKVFLAHHGELGLEDLMKRSTRIKSTFALQAEVMQEFKSPSHNLPNMQSQDVVVATRKSQLVVLADLNDCTISDEDVYPVKLDDKGVHLKTAIGAGYRLRRRSFYLLLVPQARKSEPPDFWAPKSCVAGQFARRYAALLSRWVCFAPAIPRDVKRYNHYQLSRTKCTV